MSDWLSWLVEKLIEQRMENMDSGERRKEYLYVVAQNGSSPSAVTLDSKSRE
jgi:hypothetical protein